MAWAGRAPGPSACTPICPKRVQRLSSRATWGTLAGVVTDPRTFEQLRERISAALRDSPAQDLEKNLHALLAAFFERFDLAAREDLVVQKKLLERAQAKLAALEARVAELEARKP